MKLTLRNGQVYRATPPSGGAAVELVARLGPDGVWYGRTPESEERARVGYHEGPGVPLLDLHGWLIEELAGVEVCA